ncbi:MAG TPA: alginate export family protein [Planctomycetota bacterium]|nr:alginate export family protein [Planctomycetota bacterium]
MSIKIIILTFLFAFALSGICEDAGGGFGPGPQPLTPVHWWENWGYLKDPSQRGDLFDPVKFIPFDCANDSYMSVGLEFRARYESWSNEAFLNGPPNDHDGFYLQRTMLRTDYRFHKHFRIYTELINAEQFGRKGPERTLEEDRLEFINAFVEAGCDIDETKSIDFRIGRQEMRYGSGRLIDIRDVVNNRQTFDGAKMMLKLDNWQVDGFYTHLVAQQPGVFDDTGNSKFALAGLYATTSKLPLLKGAGLDLYLLRDDNDNGLFFQGIKHEHRESAGARLFGSFHNFSYDCEGTYQFGKFGEDHISAWSSSNDIGYTFAKIQTQPKFFLRADAFSGDHNLADHSLGTFNALFPNSPYFCQDSPIGKQNMVDLHPGVEFHPHSKVTLSAGNIWYWRESVHDGTYYFNNIPMFAPISQARYIGDEQVVQVQWRALKHATVEAAFSRFHAGEFIRANPHGKDFDFVASWVTFRF